MSRLSFWHKMAFLANCCWGLAQLMKHYTFFEGRGGLEGTILIIGLVMAYFLNSLANLWALLLFISNKLKGRAPQWLLIGNLFFLVAQLYLYFA